jgi:hypothetical protein
MAGEIGHVVWAARVLIYLHDKTTTLPFWAGTLFPDIRHFGVVSRRRTHADNVSLESLAGSDDFESGMRVHAWIDATRDAFLRKVSIKEALPWHPFVPHALKLVEDEILYDRFDDWNLIHRALGRIYDDELAYVSSRKRIAEWHTALQDYFQERPTPASRRDLSLAIGLSEISAEELNNVVALLQQDARTAKVIDRTVRHFDLILQ